MDDDCDFVAELVAGRERQLVSAPEHPGIEPVVVLLRRQQSHLLVGDGDGFGAVGGLEADLQLLLLLALRCLTNLVVQERDSPCEVRGVQAAPKPPAGQFRGAGKRRAIHAGDHFEGAVLLVAIGVWRELTKPAALVVVVHPSLHDLACVIELHPAVIATRPHIRQLVAQFGVPDQRRQILDCDRHPDVVYGAVAHRLNRTIGP